MEWIYWPAWVTLIVAIVSPILTTLINNYHHAKMTRLENELKRLNRCHLLIAELVRLNTCKIEEFQGFSSKALQAAGYLDDKHLTLLLDLAAALSNKEQMGNPSCKSIGKVMVEQTSNQQLEVSKASAELIQHLQKISSPKLSILTKACRLPSYLLGRLKRHPK